MSDYFLGEIRVFGFSFAPKQWAFCNGALLGIQQNAALFSLLGTYYGGNGVQNFALPDMRSRTPIGYGTAPDGTQFTIGENGGEENVTLTLQQIPAHNHNVTATTTAANSPTVSTTTALIATVASGAYFGPPSSLVALAPQSVGNTGSTQPHTNLQPYLAVNYCISLTGLFPSRG